MKLDSVFEATSRSSTILLCLDCKAGRGKGGEKDTESWGFLKSRIHGDKSNNGGYEHQIP